jgi:pimeloyl-ACP methyl ester carboxylesterase
VTTPVRLQTNVWNPLGERRALLLHGLGSDGACWWRLASELADDGFLVVAPDLRSHGRSPATIDHSLAAFAADVLLLGEGYDVVVGHSLGGSVAASLLTRPGFATAAVLVDPVLRLDGDERERARTELRADVGVLDPEVVRARNPAWSRRDVERKVLAARHVTPTVVDAVLEHNDPWDVLETASAWQGRVHVLASDPEVGAATLPEHVAALPGSDHLTVETVVGAGHSIHRERPDVVAAAVRLVTHGEHP